MKASSVAVIDIGSNSIKVLIAVRAADGGVSPLRLRTIDTRISAGISQAEPRLTEEGMARGVDAIRALLEEAAPLAPDKMVLVATSAVRDARNGAEFRERVRAATGQAIRILTGDEEANFIGRGLTADPALRDLRDFYVFDLGGGSLECLAFRDRRIEQATSLQLGSVRLTERLVADNEAPIAPAALAAVRDHVRETFARGEFRFSLPAQAAAVGTGGSVTTVRAILGARVGKPFEETSPVVTVAEARDLLAALAPMPLAQRRKVAGLPAARADIFPVALATLLAVAELGRFDAYRNSVYNLRYGLADDLLAKL